MVKDATNMKWAARIGVVAVSLFIIVTWLNWNSPQDNVSVAKSSPTMLPRPLPVGIPRTLNVIRQDDYEALETVSCNFTTTKTEPAYKICIHDPAEDRTVSKLLYLNGVWEKAYIRNFKTLLGQYEKAWFVDVGANIGSYTLFAAAMGHHVVAVEPIEKHVNLLKKSVVLNGFQDRVTIVTNAVSDDYKLFSVEENFFNPGMARLTEYSGLGDTVSAVPISDLAKLIPEDAVVFIKMDCEGCEAKATVGARWLLNRVYVPYITMDWMHHGRMVIDEVTSYNYTTFRDVMTSHNYTMYSHEKVKLNMVNLTGDGTWEYDVIWMKGGAKKPNLHYSYH